MFNLFKDDEYTIIVTIFTAFLTVMFILYIFDIYFDALSGRYGVLISGVLATTVAMAVSLFYSYRRRDIRKEKFESAIYNIRNDLETIDGELMALEDRYQDLIEKFREPDQSNEDEVIIKPYEDEDEFIRELKFLKNRYETKLIEYQYLYTLSLYASKLEREDFSELTEMWGKSMKLITDYDEFIEDLHEMSKKTPSKIEMEVSQFDQVMEAIQSGEEPPSLREITEAELASEDLPRVGGDVS